jgi:ABC-type transport system substrate-binding protein
MDRWAVPIIPEYAQQYAQFVTGNTFSFTPRQTDVLLMRQDNARARMLKGDPPASFRTQFFGIREFATSPWRDDRVRKAMRMAIDWDAIRAQFDNRSEFEAAGIPTESRTPAHIKAGGSIGDMFWLDPKGRDFGPNAKFLLFNLQEARQLMSAAGHPNGIEMDGFINGGAEYGTTYHEIAQVTADEWARSGLFRVRIQRMPYAQYLPEVYQRREFKGISVQHPEFTYVEVDQEMFNWYHSRGGRVKMPNPSPGNPIDPRVDEFVQRQRVELDENKRVAIIHDFQRYMADKMWLLPGDGVSGGFGFQQPWYMNTAWPEHLHWIAADAPRRDQA